MAKDFPNEERGVENEQRRDVKKGSGDKEAAGQRKRVIEGNWKKISKRIQGENGKGKQWKRMGVERNPAPAAPRNIGEIMGER